MTEITKVIREGVADVTWGGASRGVQVSLTVSYPAGPVALGHLDAAEDLVVRAADEAQTDIGEARRVLREPTHDIARGGGTTP